MALTGWPLIAALGVAHVLMMLGFSAFPTLLRQFTGQWQISGTEAGLISAALFAGYTLAVPVLMAITDRLDARRIYLASAAIGILAHAGFAAFAGGFWSALSFNLLFGIALAGTYMPGLRVLGDRLPLQRMSRATGYYTAGYSLGAAISYVMTQALAARYGWPSAWWAAAAGCLAAMLIVASTTARVMPEGRARRWRSILDPRPAIANRPALAYSICYGLHTLELMTMRSWSVAFLGFTAAHHAVRPETWTPAAIAALLTLLGIAATLSGNELAMRLGRHRVIPLIMVAGGLFAFAAAASSSLSYGLCAVLVVLHGFAIMFDSSALTAGAYENAKPDQRGITMAVHSTLGFGGGAVGPFLFGVLLDVVGTDTLIGWMTAYAHMGLFVLAGPLVFRWLRRAQTVS